MSHDISELEFAKVKQFINSTVTAAIEHKEFSAKSIDDVVVLKEKEI